MQNFLKRIEIRPISECQSVINEHYTRHTNFEVLWFIQIGQCKGQLIDHERHELRDQSFSLISKGQIHSGGKGHQGYSIVIPVTFFQMGDHMNYRMLFNPFANEPLVPDESAILQLEAIMQMIRMEMESTADEHVIRTYVALLLHKLSQVNRRQAVSRDYAMARLEKLYVLIEQNYLRERNVEFYAEKIGLTSKRLNELLKDRIGLTITQLIHRFIMAEAKRLIGRDDRSMKQIAFDLGFTEQPYFSRFFKKMMGITPEQFLKSVRQEDLS